MSEKSKQKKLFNLEVAVACILASLTVICFIVQINNLNPKTTALETALFNTLQFILTIGFTWFSTRAITRSEFEKDLKRFGISAYRRITDIDKMINRLKSRISDTTSGASADSNEIKIIDAIVTDTMQIVKSSIYDWSDVIGDELIALEKIRRLESERDEIESAAQEPTAIPQADNHVKQLQVEIDKLKEQLPMMLRMSTVVDKEIDDKSLLIDTVKWFSQKHIEERGLLLRAITGSNYGSIENFKRNKIDATLTVAKDKDGSLNVLDNENNIVGRILNPLPKAGKLRNYQVASKALEVCYGKSSLQVQLVKITDTSAGRDKDLIEYVVRVLDSIKVDQEFA